MPSNIDYSTRDKYVSSNPEWTKQKPKTDTPKHDKNVGQHTADGSAVGGIESVHTHTAKLQGDQANSVDPRAALKTKQYTITITVESEGYSDSASTVASGKQVQGHARMLADAAGVRASKAWDVAMRGAK